jgi:hypothetical protein
VFRLGPRRGRGQLSSDPAPRASRSPLTRLWRSPAAPALLVLLAYAAWLAWQLPASHGGLVFTEVGDQYLRMGHGSSRIDAVPSIGQPGGYDGQFVYYIALDPQRAYSYVDLPAYRYSRPLLSLLAKAAALDQARAIPYALLLLNWLAVGLGTWFVALWLARRHVPPWYCLLYGCYPGLLVAVKYDLTEALAYCLVAAAVLAFDRRRPRRLVLSAALFACAVLSRETSAVFGLLFATSLLPWPGHGHGHGRAAGEGIAHPWLAAAGFLALVIGPYLALRLLLRLWLGAFGFYAFLSPVFTPFGGLLAWFPWTPTQINEARSLALPALICLAMGLLALAKRGPASLAIWLLLANVALLACLNQSSYRFCPDAARIGAGVPLAALYALPSMDRLTGGNRIWILACGLLWLWLVPGWATVPVGRSLL